VAFNNQSHRSDNQTNYLQKKNNVDIHSISLLMHASKSILSNTEFEYMFEKAFQFQNFHSTSCTYKK